MSQVAMLLLSIPMAYSPMKLGVPRRRSRSKAKAQNVKPFKSRWGRPACMNPLVTSVK